MKLADLTPHPGNPRVITDDELKRLEKSLDTFGDLSGIVYNRRTKRVIGGHQRLKILPKETPITISEKYKKPTRNGTTRIGFIEIAGERFQFREVDVDETIEKAMNIAANKHGGDWSLPDLSSWLLELDAANFDMDLTGFGKEELENVMAPINKVEGQCDEDEVPEPKEAIAKRGDIYQLGRHRLMCGDSTVITDVEALMEGDIADLLWTDPPYGVSYADKNAFLNVIAPSARIEERIQNDHMSPDKMNELWFTALSNAHTVLSDRSSYYIASPQGGDLMMMMMSIIRAGFQLKHMLIWVKNNHVLGRCDYNYRHEPILYGWKKNGSHEFYGNGACKTSVWEFDKPLKNDLHPTMKPLALIEEALLNSTLSNQSCLDPFGGSGSTLIACEKINRRCFMMEIDPHYCSIIIARWEKFTGKKATLLDKNRIESEDMTCRVEKKESTSSQGKAVISRAGRGPRQKKRSSASSIASSSKGS